MSVYPRKRTNSRHLRRSALCQKRTLARLFDHVVGAGEKRFRDGQSDRLCGLEVYDQLEFGRQLNRQLRGICTLENEIDIRCCAAEQIRRIVAERYQATALREVAIAVNRREAVSGR